MIAAFEFNSNQPRFYSKYFKSELAGYYDVTLAQAAGSSASAPIYFDPNSYTNVLGLKETLVDGGIICNNPALYAYLLAKYLKGHKEIRVVSLGTGKDIEKIEKSMKS